MMSRQFMTTQLSEAYEALGDSLILNAVPYGAAQVNIVSKFCNKISIVDFGLQPVLKGLISIT